MSHRACRSGALEPIAREPGRDFTVADFPKANHALVETTTGLTSEMLRSDTFAPGLFAEGRELGREPTASQADCPAQAALRCVRGG